MRSSRSLLLLHRLSLENLLLLNRTHLLRLRTESFHTLRVLLPAAPPSLLLVVSTFCCVVSNDGLSVGLMLKWVRRHKVTEDLALSVPRNPLGSPDAANCTHGVLVTFLALVFSFQLGAVR